MLRNNIIEIKKVVVIFLSNQWEDGDKNLIIFDKSFHWFFLAPHWKCTLNKTAQVGHLFIFSPLFLITSFQKDWIIRPTSRHVFLKKKKQILKNCSKKELRDSIWVFYVCAVAKINQTYITQPSRKKPK